MDYENMWTFVAILMMLCLTIGFVTIGLWPLGIVFSGFVVLIFKMWLDKDG